jgi:hypothetical protein
MSSAIRTARRHDQAQAVVLVRIVEVRLPVGGGQARRLGHDPYLQEAHILIVGCVELAVAHAGAGGHRLHVAAPDHALAAGRILVRQRAAHDIGDDLHIAMAVGREAGAGLHRVVIDHAQAAEAHVRRVVVVREREGVAAIEPIDVLAAPRFRGSTDNAHDVVSFRSGWPCGARPVSQVVRSRGGSRNHAARSC